jgi:hypothetical protein
MPSFSLFDPSAGAPALGRLRGVAGRHRFREADEPPTLPPGACFEVRDAAALAGGSLLANEDGMLVITGPAKAALAGVLRKAADDLYVTEVALADGAGTAWILTPTQTASADSPNSQFLSHGHALRSADTLTLEDTDDLPAIARVDYTALYSLRSDVIAALAKSGLAPPLRDPDAAVTPPAASPYQLLAFSRIPRGAAFKRIDCATAPAGTPERNPLAAFIRREDRGDGEQPGDPYWGTIADRRMLEAYITGTPLRGPITMQMEKPASNDKLADRLATHYVVLSAAAREVFEAAGVVADWLPVTILDVKGAPRKKVDHTLCVPRVVRPWLDWERSDVNWTRSNSIWGVRELVMTGEVASATDPLVRIENTRLHLAAPALTQAIREAKLTGFRFVDPADYSLALNMASEFPLWET